MKEPYVYVAATDEIPLSDILFGRTPAGRVEVITYHVPASEPEDGLKAVAELCEAVLPWLASEDIPVVFNSYGGFDDDPRELWFVPEFRAFAAQVLRRHPAALVIEANSIFRASQRWEPSFAAAARSPVLMLALLEVRRISETATDAAPATPEKAGEFLFGLARVMAAMPASCGHRLLDLLRNTGLGAMARGAPAEAQQALVDALVIQRRRS